MIKIENNKVELSKTCILTKKQIHKIKTLDQADQLKYALSILGLSKTRLSVNPRDQLPNDRLANKQKHSVLRQFRGLLDSSSEKLHRPLARSNQSNWVGVEIECLVPGDEESSCDTCGGSGEHSCYNCEGRGQLTLEDDNGNEYRVDCTVCDGSGNETCDDCGGSCSSGDSIHERIRNKLEQAKITNCSVKSDGSLHGSGAVGVEVTVLFDARHGFEKLQKVCKILNDLGATVNDSCGLHVHLDQYKNSESTSKQIGKRLGKFLPILSQLVPSTRRKNTYCKMGVSHLDGCRYYAVNMTSLNKHRTIEVRLHSGTTNAQKIEQWVKLLTTIVNRSNYVPSPVTTFQGLIDTLQLNESAIEYWDKRFQKFNPNDETHAPVAQPEILDDESQGIELEQGA